MRIVIAIIFLIIGIIMWIVRASRNSSSQAKGEKLAHAMESDPEVAKKYASELGFLYGTRKTAAGELSLSKIREIVAKKALGKFILLGSLEVQKGKVLIATNRHDMDFVVGMRGRTRDVKEVLSYNFVVAYNADQQQLEVYSELYSDLTDKNNMTEFGTLILPLLG